MCHVMSCSNLLQSKRLVDEKQRSRLLSPLRIYSPQDPALNANGKLPCRCKLHPSIFENYRLVIHFRFDYDPSHLSSMSLAAKDIELILKFYRTGKIDFCIVSITNGYFSILAWTTWLGQGSTGWFTGERNEHWWCYRTTMCAYSSCI